MFLWAKPDVTAKNRERVVRAANPNPNGLARYGVQAAALIMLSIAATGCSGGLSTKSAETAINTGWKEERVVMKLDLGRVGRGCLIDPTNDLRFLAAAKAGRISVAPDGDGYWKVDLKDGKTAGDGLASGGCNYHGFVDVIALRSVAAVSKVTELPDGTAEAEFTWKWSLTPDGETIAAAFDRNQLNELDALLINPLSAQADTYFRLADLDASTKVHAAKRVLQKSPDGWRLVINTDSAADVVQEKLAAQPKSMQVEIGRVGSHCAEDIGGHEIEFDRSPDESIYTLVTAKAGYLSFAPEGKGFWRVELTEKGRVLVRQDSENNGLFLETGLKGCDYQHADFIVARAALVKITDIKNDENSPEVRYLWKWVPTPLGSALQKDGEVYAKLSPAQRESLRMSFAGDEFSPQMPMPVPAEQESITTGVATLKHEHGHWTW